MDVCEERVTTVFFFSTGSFGESTRGTPFLKIHRPFSCALPFGSASYSRFVMKSVRTTTGHPAARCAVALGHIRKAFPAPAGRTTTVRSRAEPPMLVSRLLGFAGLKVREFWSVVVHSDSFSRGDFGDGALASTTVPCRIRVLALGATFHMDTRLALERRFFFILRPTGALR